MKRILCYGDSNTHGCNPLWTADWENDTQKGVRLSEEERWTGILQKMLGPEYRIIEEGLPGRTTVYPDPVCPYLDGRSSLMQCIASQSPIDLFLVMLGTNDLKVTFSPSVSTLGKAMEVFLKQLLNPYIWEHRIVPPVLVVAPPQIRNGVTESQFGGMYDEKSAELSKKLAGIYEDLCRRYNCEFLNASLYAKASTLDCIHMNPENHRKLAVAIEEKIKKIFAGSSADTKNREK